MNAMPMLPSVSFPPHGVARQKTVLIVDNFAPLCDLVARHLSSVGYRVLTAYSGAEAQSIARSSHVSAIDLLLTDLEMPGMRGNQLAEWFSSEYPQTPVLFMSTWYDAVPYPAEAHFLPKPFSLAQLGSAVREALGLPPGMLTPAMETPHAQPVPRSLACV